jgi:hypothetical protein
VDKTITVRFNKDHEYEVYKARVEAGYPVHCNQIIEHPMVGRICTSHGTKFFVESAQKHWSRGYYVVLLLNNFNDSHTTLHFETIGNCYDEAIMEYIAKGRSETTFTDEVIGEKERLKIERRYKIGHLLHSNLVRKHTDWKEEYAMVEKAGLLTP